MEEKMEHLGFLVKCLEEDKVDELFGYLRNVDTGGLDILYYFSEIIELAYLDCEISKKILDKSVYIYQKYHMPADY